MSHAVQRFVRFAWLNLGYNLLVILWGAFVRATGSGAGCGDHWPLCDGQVIPQAPDTAQMIEFSHRVTSGIALILAIVLLVWALRLFAKGQAARRMAIASFVIIIIEALLGAGLVLFELTADNASMARAFAMGLHLANTFLLIGAQTLTAWFAGGRPTPRFQDQGAVPFFLLAALLGTMLVGSSGAVTALGDTLLHFAHVDASHPLVVMRVIHPLLGTIVGVAMLLVARMAVLRDSAALTVRLAWSTAGVFILQILLGGINVLLKAPVWMQLVHLLMADLAWILLVLLSVTVLAVQPQRAVQTITARATAD